MSNIDSSATAPPARWQTVDPDTRAPHGHPCDACGSPVEPGEKFCAACGAPQAAPKLQPRGDAKPADESVSTETLRQKFFRCQKCGSEVATDATQRSYTCPFCDSTYVAEFSPQQTGRQRPEFVIGFTVTPDDAQEKFRAWIRDNGWFRPGDLRRAMVADKMKGIYLPFWSFSMLAQSHWSATVGEHWYRTETYTETDSKGHTVTRTRQVQETEWWPLGGRHHHYYSGYLVSGSRGLPQSDAERIKPFNLPALRRYEPYFLAGWFCEEYSVTRDEALLRCREVFQTWEQTNIGSFLPGDTHHSLQVQTEFSQINSDLCLLPVYVLSYRYQEKLYRFLVNGQTGKVAGDKPLSWKRISAFVASILLLILIVWLLIAWFKR